MDGVDVHRSAPMGDGWSFSSLHMSGCPGAGCIFSQNAPPVSTSACLSGVGSGKWIAGMR